VVIITKGKVVAVDTPENLTHRLQGAETMYVQLDAADVDASPALQAVPGVTRVGISDRHGTAVGYEVEGSRGQDIRRDLAAAVVSKGWGLLELRPLRMSLEEIFLQVTTEEVDPKKPEPTGKTKEAAQ
jgi:ABC-2 type transport system ATP-binding protein